MPFEALPAVPRSIAVIGGGISGMGAAYMLAKGNHVTLFEAEPEIGGHARTRMAGRKGDTPVDTGFIVFNYANYPYLTTLFDELEVPVQKSDMSFGASILGGRFEYGLRNMGAVFAQKRNLIDSRFMRMLRDVMHFNRHGLEAAQEPGLTIGGLLKKLGTGEWFRRYYLLPLSGAIWSTPVEKIMDFPAHAMMEFFKNHALLHHTGQHQWYTVTNGSRSYVSRLQNALERRGVDIRTSAAVAGVRRFPTHVEVRAFGGEWERFDDVIFATHSDDTLRMIADPTAEERAVLGAIGYQPNRIVLHSDASVMPKRKSVWASWVYTEVAGKADDQIDLTYWMNSLQPWLKNEQFFVTLNSNRTIREDLIWDEVTLRHPVYDLAALDAQAKVPQMQGKNGTWFCGAWVKNGFHEDGLSSAVDVVAAFEAAAQLGVAAG